MLHTFLSVSLLRVAGLRVSGDGAMLRQLKLGQEGCNGGCHPTYAAPANRGGTGEPIQPFALGVLFIHGIGTRERGQTLAEFGAPLFRWTEERFRALHHRWVSYGASPPNLFRWYEKHLSAPGAILPNELD